MSWLAAAGALSHLPAQAASTPKRDMIVRSSRPEDLEMPMDGFGTWLTPNDRFFVRSHHYTPEVRLQDWRLQVAGSVERALTLTMEELKSLPRVEVVGVLECAGNGRGLYRPPVIGLQWRYGAVGNARWAGVRLVDLLRKAGVRQSGRHVLFDGADVRVGTMPEFQRTVPIRKALDPFTLLAYEMNGEPLPVSHGFPLRLVVPGWAGDSWVKWVTRIEVLDQEYEGFFMKTAYRHPRTPVRPGSAVDPAKMHPVEALRVKSLIAAPVEGSRVGTGPIRVTGAAWSGGAPVTRVEVSTDRGRTWQRARMAPEQSLYAWRLWEFSWTPARPGYYVLMVRARDAMGGSQPFAQEWNPSGYLWNVVHEVGVEVSADLRASQIVRPAAARAPEPPPPPAGFQASCLSCHEADVMAQQRLSREQWEREVDKMIRWGAPVKPEDREGILQYLFSAYGR